MKEITLLLSIYGDTESAIRSIEAMVKNKLKDLDVKSKIQATERGWTRIAIEGEDEDFAANYLVKEYGSPVKKVDSGKVYRGYIKYIDDNGVTVDIGIPLTIAPNALKSLGTGRPTQVASRFGIIPHLPVSIEIVEHEGKTVARFTKEQVDRWWEWKKSGIDRVVINSSTRSKIKAAIKKKGHGKDIYAIERIGVMEHVIVCREGTDGPGIVAEIGPLIKADMGVIIGS